MRASPVTTLKRPEYVGENRCLPCTVLNVLIAIGLGGALVAVGTLAGATIAGLVVGAVAFVLSLSAIYLRGYLVPGTPTLTRRYVPARVLRAFGKAPAAEPDVADGPVGELVAAGVLEAGSGGGGFSLADDCRSEWTRAVDRADEIGSDGLADVFDTTGYVEIHAIGDAFRVHVDGPMVGKWPSRAAFLADLGSVAVLSDRIERWDQRPVEDRARLLSRLRRAVGTCPECGGEPEAGTETVEGCCSTFDATTVSCGDCGERLSLETCPECGDATELGTESLDGAGESLPAATVSCIDCGERVFALPSSFSPP